MTIYRLLGHIRTCIIERPYATLYRLLRLISPYIVCITCIVYTLPFAVNAQAIFIYAKSHGKLFFNF